MAWHHTFNYQITETWKIIVVTLATKMVSSFPPMAKYAPNTCSI